MTNSGITYLRNDQRIELQQVTNLDEHGYPKDGLLRGSDLFESWVLRWNKDQRAYADPEGTLVLYVSGDVSKATSGRVLAKSKFGKREVRWEADSVYEQGDVRRHRYNGDRFSDVAELVQGASEEQEAESLFGRRILDFLEGRDDINVKGRLSFHDSGFPYQRGFDVPVTMYVPTREGSDYANCYQMGLRVSVSDEGTLGVSVYSHNLSQNWVTSYDRRGIEPDHLEQALVEVIDRLPEDVCPQWGNRLEEIAERGDNIKKLNVQE